MKRSDLFSRPPIVAFLAAWFTALAAAGPAPALEPLAVVGGTLLDGTDAEAVEDAVVVIVGEKIRCAGARGTCPIPDDAVRMDASGSWLIPGLIDTHVHLRHAKPELLGHTQKLRLARGITSVRDAGTHGALSRNLIARVEARAPRHAGPRIYVSGVLSPASLRETGPAVLLRRHVAAGVDGIKLKGGFDPGRITGLARVAHSLGVPIYGHTFDRRASDIVTFTREAVEAGIDGIVHLSGIAAACLDSQPDLPPASAKQRSWRLYWKTLWLHTDPQKLAELAALMLERGVWLEPTLFSEEKILRTERYRRAREASRLPVGGSARSPLSEADRERVAAALERMLAFVGDFHAKGGTLLPGSDAVSVPGFAFHEELSLLARAGVPAGAVLRAATRDAARVLGWGDRLGTLEAGKLADLVVVGADPSLDIQNAARVRTVIKGGAVFDPEELLASLPSRRVTVDPGQSAPAPDPTP